MREDGEYRRRIRQFRLTTLGTTAAFCAMSWINPSGNVVVSVASYILLTLVYLAYVLYASFSIQSFQNEKIGDVLQADVV